MSVQVLRIILLIAVAACVKIMYKCKISSPGKVAMWIIMFPTALFLIDYAALFVFRGFDYGALIYGGDDVTQEEWDNREWRNCEGIRYNLVLLCKKLVHEI